MPAIGAAQTLHPSMGTGAVISQGLEPAAMARASRSPDPNQNGPTIVVVRLRGGVGTVGGLAALQHIAAVASRVIDHDPQAGGGTFVVLSVQQPAEIIIYTTIGATPTVLAGALAAGAILALGVTLVASVRRRPRDLALLKSLGFIQRQLAATVAWQATVAAVVGIVFGIPLGIALGRWLWTLFAREIYAVPMPTVPVVDVVLVAVSALVLANLVAARSRAASMRELRQPRFYAPNNQHPKELQLLCVCTAYADRPDSVTLGTRLQRSGCHRTALSAKFDDEYGDIYRRRGTKCVPWDRSSN